MPDNHRVRLAPDGATFEVAAGENVLDAALRQGIALEYGCRHGNCASCKYLLTEGDVDFGCASPYSLSEQEREDGWALLCCATPLEDLEIQDRVGEDLRRLPVISPEIRAGQVRECKRLTEVLWHLVLSLDEPLTFYPGQFVELGIPGRDDEWRSYSIASPASRDQELEFIIGRVPDGAFSGQLESLTQGAELSLRGPFGTGYLRAGSAPIMLVGTGSGIAPLLSILRSAAESGDTREIRFYYGARTRADLVFVAEIESLSERLTHFSFRPTLSRPTEACRWQGLEGRVTLAMQQTVPDASPYDAYVCGMPEMCETIGRLLEAKGIEDGHIFFDRFHHANVETKP